MRPKGEVRDKSKSKAVLTASEMVESQFCVGFIITLIASLAITASRDEKILGEKNEWSNFFEYWGSYFINLPNFIGRLIDVKGGTVKPPFCLVISLVMYLSLMMITNNIVLSIAGSVVILLDESFLRIAAFDGRTLALFLGIILVAGTMLSVRAVVVSWRLAGVFIGISTVIVVACACAGTTIPLLIWLLAFVGLPRINIRNWKNCLITGVNVVLAIGLALVIDTTHINADGDGRKHAKSPFTYVMQVFGKTMSTKARYENLMVYIVPGLIALVFSWLKEKREVPSYTPFFILGLCIFYVSVFPVGNVSSTEMTNICNRRISQMKLLLHLTIFIRLGHVNMDKTLSIIVTSIVVALLMLFRLFAF